MTNFIKNILPMREKCKNDVFRFDSVTTQYQSIFHCILVLVTKKLQKIDLVTSQ